MSRPNDDIPPLGELFEEPDDAPLVVDGVANAHATLKNVFVLTATSIWIWRNLELKGVAMPEEVREESWDKIMDARSEGRARGLVSEGGWWIEYIQQRIFRDGRAVHRTSWLLKLPFAALAVRYGSAHLLQGQNVDRGHWRRSTDFFYLAFACSSSLQDTITGLLLAGVGHINEHQKKNFLVVDPSALTNLTPPPF